MPRTGWLAASANGAASRRAALACRCRGCCPTTCPGWMPSSSAAAPPTCRRGWRAVGPRWSASTTSEAQLATARRLADEHGIELTLIHGNAESVPYPDASFDFATRSTARRSGATRTSGSRGAPPAATRRHVGLPRFVDPGDAVLAAGWLLAGHRTARARLLLDPSPRLARCRGRARRHRVQPADVEMVPAVRRHRLRRRRLHRDPGPPTDQADEVRFFVTAEWAHRYPSEQVWVLRKR